MTARLREGSLLRWDAAAGGSLGGCVYFLSGSHLQALGSNGGSEWGTGQGPACLGSDSWFDVPEATLPMRRVVPPSQALRWKSCMVATLSQTPGRVRSSRGPGVRWDGGQAG